MLLRRSRFVKLEIKYTARRRARLKSPEPKKQSSFIGVGLFRLTRNKDINSIMVVALSRST